jgi:hypothetical protein
MNPTLGVGVAQPIKIAAINRQVSDVFFIVQGVL